MALQPLTVDSDKLLLNVYQTYSHQFCPIQVLLFAQGRDIGNNHSHLHTSTTVFEPMYRVKYLLKCTPPSSFFCNKSRSLKQRIRSMFASSPFRHISLHWRMVSSRIYIPEPSTSRWSKQEIGAKKRIACTVSKVNVRGLTKQYKRTHHHRRRAPKLTAAFLTHTKCIPSRYPSRSLLVSHKNWSQKHPSSCASLCIHPLRRACPPIFGQRVALCRSHIRRKKKKLAQ